jgi:hypothetical protein
VFYQQCVSQTSILTFYFTVVMIKFSKMDFNRRCNKNLGSKLKPLISLLIRIKMNCKLEGINGLFSSMEDLDLNSNAAYSDQFGLAASSCTDLIMVRLP